MSNPDPVKGTIKPSLETFIDTLFEHKRGEEIVYLGDKFSNTKSIAVIKGLQDNPRKNKKGLYFVTGAFLPEAKNGSEFSRQGQFIERYHVLLLDDIGGKYPEPEFDPTYSVESSEGNYQWGYGLDRGYTVEEMQTFLERMKKKDICDPGGLKLNQLARLPAGVNGKVRDDGTIDMFEVHLAEWYPENQFSLAELTKLFDLPELTAEDKRFVRFLGKQNPATKEQIEEHPILALINSRPETALREIEDGKLHIQCPNHEAHEGGFTGDKETSLMMREDGSYHFSCFHGHCNGAVGRFDFDDWQLMATFEALKPVIEALPEPVDGGLFDQVKELPPIDNPPIELISIKPDWFSVEPEPDRFTVHPYFPCKAVTLLTATGGIGKSLLALHASVCVATGRPFLGGPITGRKVTYLSLEDNEERVRRRLYYSVAKADVDAVVENMTMIDRYGKQTHVVSSEHGDVQVSDTPDEIIAAFKGAGLDLLIVDTLVRAHSVNENDNALMSTVLVAFEHIAAELDCAVVLLHHVAKAAATKGDSSHMGRGASAIGDNSRSAISLVPATIKETENMTNVTGDMVSEQLLVKVQHTKHNYSAKAPDRWILKQGAFIEEFIPQYDARPPEASRYEELYRWWTTSHNSRPLAKGHIDPAVDAIRMAGAKHGKNTYRAALDWAVARDFAKATGIKGDNPNATYYELSPIPDTYQ